MERFGKMDFFTEKENRKICGSLEADYVAASILGFGDEERLEVKVRTRPLGPWSDFVGWSRGKFLKFAQIFPAVVCAFFFALFLFTLFSDLQRYDDGRGFSSNTLIVAVSAVLVLLFGVIIVALLLNRTDFSILFRKDSVVVSCARPYFEKVIRRDEILQIFCKEQIIIVGATPFYELLLLDSGAGTRSLVSGVRSFETANFIESNANRIMGIAVGRAGSYD